MLYELAHFIKDKCSFLWNAVEWTNASLFALKYRGKLNNISQILEGVSNNALTIRMTVDSDAKKLELFFAAQPESAFEFFEPHGFDEKSVLKVLKNKAFMTFIVTVEDEIVGYFFLRAFVNGKCFRGKIVDYRWRNKGIAKQMGNVTNDIAKHLGLRIFASISPDNYASMASSKAVNDVKIVKTLENGYYYIEYTSKSNN